MKALSMRAPRVGIVYIVSDISQEARVNPRTRAKLQDGEGDGGR